jgi:TRAP transporter TAXI family solute receptor
MPNTSWRALLCLAIASVSMAAASNSMAQTSPQKTAPARNTVLDQLRAKVNENTVSIVSGNPNGGYLGIAYDISTVVDDGDNMRVLPIVGKGAVQNVRDVLFLRGVDMGLVNTVTLSYYRENPELGRYVSRQMVYITRLFEDELHILVRPDIKTFKDLVGKRINFSDAGSGAQLAAQRMFAAFGMQVVEANMGQADAIEKMKRGELDATLCTCLKPLKPYQSVAADLGFKLLEVPYDGPLETDYVPANFTHEDYPNLIPKGEKVSTVAVPTALVAFNWPAEHERYKRIAKFVDAMFSKFPELHKPPRHPRWKNVNLAATLQGWNRFPGAQAWLDRAAASAPPTVATAAQPALVQDGSASTVPVPASQQKLFQEFMEWRRSKAKQ